MSITNPRVGPRVIAGVAWQATEGVAANVADIIKLQAYEFEIEPEGGYIDPQGTTGSFFMVDSHRLVSLEPVASIGVYGSKSQIATFLESLTGGQPTATQADGDVAETGDDQTDYNNWSLTGVRIGVNTDAAGKLYMTCLDDTPVAGTSRIQVFSDAAKTSLVAQGDIPDNTAAGAIAEQNNSGLSVTVDVAVVGAGDLDIELTVQKITFNWSGQWDRFFTLWRDDGQRLEELTDCVVKSMTLTSEDKGPLQIEADIVSREYTSAASALNVPGAALGDIYAHQDVTLRSGVGGVPKTQSPLSVEFKIDSDFVAPLGAATRPEKIIRKRTEIFVKYSAQSSDEGDARITNAIADTFDSMDAVYSLGGKDLTMTWARTKTVDFKFPNYSDGEIEEQESDHIARAQGAAGLPLTITMEN